LTLPGKKLLIDYDNRAQALAGEPDVKILRCWATDPKSPEPWRRAETIRRELAAAVRVGELPYTVVIEDGLSSMNRICMYWSLLLDSKRGLGGSPAKQHYGPHIKNLADHILTMLALPVHYVLTGHFNVTEDESTGETHMFPKVYGKQQKTEIPTWFDECYLSYKRQNDKTHEDEYYWHTSGFGRYDFMKSSLNKRGDFWKNPVRIDLNKPPVGFEKLLDLRFGKKEGKDE
ncbi:hypothetical protein LCGC14_3132750, partial [marine sediment metagenome]